MIQLSIVRIKCNNQITQNITGCELSENHSRHLIPTVKSANMLIAMVF